MLFFNVPFWYHPIALVFLISGIGYRFAHSVLPGTYGVCLKSTGISKGYYVKVTLESNRIISKKSDYPTSMNIKLKLTDLYIFLSKDKE